jgi:hypothetical protein
MRNIGTPWPWPACPRPEAAGSPLCRDAAVPTFVTGSRSVSYEGGVTEEVRSKAA